MYRVLVTTCLRTGEQTVRREEWDRALVFLAQCRPMEVRQVYDRNHRQVARAERLTEDVVDADCDADCNENGGVMWRKY